MRLRLPSLLLLVAACGGAGCQSGETLPFDVQVTAVDLPQAARSATFELSDAAGRKAVQTTALTRRRALAGFRGLARGRFVATVRLLGEYAEDGYLSETSREGVFEGKTVLLNVSFGCKAGDPSCTGPPPCDDPGGCGEGEGEGEGEGGPAPVTCPEGWILLEGECVEPCASDGAFEACLDDARCVIGQRRCNGAVWGECEGSSPPERCGNDTDDDCDGEVDEGCGGPCQPGVEEATCPHGETCFEDWCRTSCREEDDRCRDDEVCHLLVCPPCPGCRCEGVCLSPDEGCADVVCPEGTACVEGECITECQPGQTRACRYGCVVGTQDCEEGRWADCTGHIDCTEPICRAFPECEPECEPGGERECREGCVDGLQRCENGRWGACDGELDCDDPVCHALHPQCDDAPCEPGELRECREDCTVGVQECNDGSWDACTGGIDCEDDECRDRFPEECGAAGCPHGATRDCHEGCTIGTQACVGGSWTACRGAPDCDDAECRRLHEQCWECVPGNARECGDRCTTGRQECVDGRWGPCEAQVDCSDPDCAELREECRECANGEVRGCREDCVVGRQTCRNRRWGGCIGDWDCDDPECAAAHADCWACQPSAVRRCVTDCVTGVQLCGNDGIWGECVGQVHCHVEACAGLFPDRCPAQCVDGQARECVLPPEELPEDVDQAYQVCRGGRWEPCEAGCVDADSGCVYPCCLGVERLFCSGANDCRWPCGCIPNQPG